MSTNMKNGCEKLLQTAFCNKYLFYYLLLRSCRGEFSQISFDAFQHRDT